MASRKPVKPYALDLLSEIRKDTEYVHNRNMAAVDLAEVIKTSPKIIVEPHHENAEYDENYLIFNIDPDSLSVGDLIVLGRTPSNQPIVLGIANDRNEDPFFNEDLQAFKNNAEFLRENTNHWKASVESFADLPLSDNDDGDLRYSLSDNIIYRWQSSSSSWISIDIGLGDYLPLTGGTLTGNLVMEPGTNITLPDGPVNPTDAANKLYVDSLVAGPSFFPATSIDDTDSPYNIQVNEQVILVDSSSGLVSVILPAVHISGKVYDIKDSTGSSSTNNITISSSDGDTIDGSPSYVIERDYEAVRLVSNGSDWFIL